MNFICYRFRLDWVESYTARIILYEIYIYRVNENIKTPRATNGV